MGMSQKQQKVPKLRFPGYEGEWEEKKLEQIADIIGGGTPSTKENAYWDGDINWYAPAELGDRIFLSESERKITQLGLEKSSAKLLPIGTVLFTSRAGIGNTAILSKEGATNQGFQSIVPKEEILDSYFIYSRTYELKSYAEKHGAGSTFIEISGREFGKMVIQIPTINEQRKIGTLFEKIDKLLSLHQQKLGHLKLQKQALLQKLFPKKGEKVPELRFPGFDGKWEERTLGELFAFSKGKGYALKDLIESGSPIFLYGQLYTNYKVKIDEVSTFANLKQNSVTSDGNEILIPSSGETANEIARASVIKQKGVILGSDLNVLRPTNELDTTFIALSLTYSDSQKQMRKYAEGASVVHLYNSSLKHVRIKIPTIGEQVLISNLFLKLDELLVLQEQKLDRLKLQKKALLQQMFV